jgi:hypothetical protein
MATPSYDGFHRALQVVGYELELRSADYRLADPIDAVDALRRQAQALPATGPLAQTYGSIARLAALALTCLAALPSPDEVDGLTGFEGFDVWRAGRPT